MLNCAIQPGTATSLAAISLFSTLRERALTRLATSTSVLELARGAVLYTRRDPNTGMHALVPAA